MRQTTPNADVEQVIGGLYRLYKSGDAAAAVAAARAHWDEDGPLDDLAALCAAILVDRGGDLADMSAVSAGIEIFGRLVEMEGTEPSARQSYRYNLSNGYGALAVCHERAGDDAARLDAWKLQRDELQAIILDPKDVSKELMPQILTNFGNCLSQLGRKAEAIDAYSAALRLRPGHPIAAGCAGQAMLHLLGIQPAHNARVLFRAKELLEVALSDLRALNWIGGPGARSDFEKSLREVDAYASKMFEDGADGLESQMASYKETHQGWKPKGDVAGWASLGLLLTVNPYPELCPSTLADDLFFDGLSTAAGDHGLARFTLLAHTLNQIKEEYATSRYLLFQAGRTGELEPLSKITHFADTLDYADFGLSSGLLKTSMRLSIDLLDKVAVFLNRYLELGIREKSVSFATVWYESGNANKGIEGAELAKHLAANNFLRGIRDVAETLNVYPAQAKEIRNKATHDFVIIENAVRPQVRLNGKVVTADAHEFSRHLLSISRGVIINLIAFVQGNEGRRKTELGKVASPISFRYARGISDELERDDHPDFSA